MAQVFYIKFCDTSKSAFFTEHLRWLLLWFILVASIVVTWVSWFSRHKFKLEAEDFIFHILQRNFPNFGVKILALWLAKSLRSFCFSLCRSQLIYSCLVKTFPKRNKSKQFFKLIQTTSYFSKASIRTNSGGCILLAKLVITCQLEGKTTN